MTTTSTRRLRVGAIATAIATATSILVAPGATAQDTAQVLISEVYGGGGNSGSVYSYDFVELYNPTDSPIDVSGWVLDQKSAAGNVGTSHTLSGTIPAQGYYLVQGEAGANPSTDLPTPDEAGSFNFSGSKAVAELRDASGATADLVGWGSASQHETSPAAGTSNSTSVQRRDPSVDTDDNSADFHVAAPTPVSSTEGTAPSPETPENPETPTGAVTIAEIQGTGDTTPLDGKKVTTEGIVTAVYDEGGKNGVIIQTPGTGSEQKSAGDASDAIFVYLGNRTDYPALGEAVTVTGTAGEHYGTTQLSGEVTVTATEGLAEVTPVELDYLPNGDDAREAYEHMLIQPTGTHTVTNNYNLNRFGEIGLSPNADTALLQPTDVVLPGQEAIDLQAANDAALITLDDGSTRDYTRGEHRDTPLPYLSTDSGETITPIRTDKPVDFQHPVVLDFDLDLWRFQPTAPVTGATASADLPIRWDDHRAGVLEEISTVDGDITFGTFNVLNYFTSLGENEAGCGSYDDRFGQPVTTNRCQVRGAYSASAFADQQSKIVSAINQMDADIIGLQEIENTYGLTGDVERRDEALAGLVDSLNEAAGEKRWSHVASPEKLGTDEDVIRLAFIYQADAVEPVGQSRIFDDAAYTGTARQPLAQEFAPVAGGESFVVVANHFKSKGSVPNGDADTGDGQGNNATVRTNQAQALLDHLDKQEDWANSPVFIIGDLNSYARENSIRTLEANGFTNVNTEFAGHTPTYQFDGQLGSLDHVLGNEAAMKLVQDAAVWEINGDEALAFEYSRRNYNVVDFHDDSPFRSSDHDPIKVGLSFGDNSDDDTPQKPSNPKGPKGPGSSAAVAGLFGLLIALGATGGVVAALINRVFPAEVRDYLKQFGL